MGSTGGGSHPYKEGGGDQEVFVLTWNDFHTQFVSSFQEMRSEGDFLDTTVACSSGENHQLPVRWFRIATMQPPCEREVKNINYFENWFRANFLNFFKLIIQTQLTYVIGMAYPLMGEKLLNVSKSMTDTFN